MIIVRPDQIEEFANRLSTDRALRAGEKSKIKAYVLANCVGMTNEQIVVHLATAKDVPNPVPQGTVNVRTRDEALRKMFRIGKITQQELINAETDAVPDPAWQPTVHVPAPLETLGFEQGAIIGLNELERLMV